MLELPAAAAVYCALVGIAFVCGWLYYDRRDHAAFEGERRRATFHCVRCDRLYGAPGAPNLCRCPRCGHENARLRF